MGEANIPVTPPKVWAILKAKGGSFRISLTYDAPTETGKTTAQTDTYHGR